MTTKLWLDDVRRPLDEGMIVDEEEREQWLWVKTYQEAIDALATGQFTEVSLDYSLDETDWKHTGMDVAKWLAEKIQTGQLPPMQCDCHSFNWKSRADMEPYCKIIRGD